MQIPLDLPVVGFEGSRRIGQGPLRDVIQTAVRAVSRGSRGDVVLFNAETSERIEVDLRGSAEDVVARLEGVPPAPRTAGRPKLGVVAREVTLLPRHWDWLSDQPGGASVTLRKLVDQARQSNVESDRVRKARDATYRFILDMGGDRPGFEEASRALFAGNRTAFLRHIERWPADIKAHAKTLIQKVTE
ncbi:MAG: DUF2239 family protein [Gemmatimonadaceae bacterium]